MNDKDPQDPREMRQLLTQVGWGRSLMDDSRRMPSAGESLVRNINRLADNEGLSGEDRYTMMAWHLLKHAQALEKLVIEDMMLRPPSISLTGLTRPCRHKNTDAVNPLNNAGAVLRCADCGAVRGHDEFWRRP